MPMSLPQHNSSATVDSSRQNQGEGGSSATAAASVRESTNQEFSREERVLLLRLAHDSITSALEHREVSLGAPTLHLAERRGAFTSLYLRRNGGGKDLRGCVGYVLPSCTVYRAVAETARAAAFSDNRFSPVTIAEAPLLEVELSILTAPQPISPGDIQVGRHGLLISWHGRRGLLLPQVALEHEWDAATFLQQTCRKAMLPPDAWQKDAMIEAFTAEIFGDNRQ
jgi:AmmeMemoRadiSam system protein A